MPVGNKKIEKLLVQSHIAIVNALKAGDIFEVLRGFGYNRKRLREGRELHDRVSRLCWEQRSTYASQLKAGEVYRTALKTAKERYRSYRHVSRAALRGYPSLEKIIGLDTASRRAFGSWMEESRQFYVNALDNSDILERFSNFGVTRAGLREGLRMVGEAEKAGAQHETLKGRVTKTTRERNQVFDEFMDWMGDFKRICRVAFVDSPQKLEKLGIVVRS